MAKKTEAEGTEKSEYTEAQLNAAIEAFEANKKLQKVFVTTDAQAFENEQFAIAHSREVGDREHVVFERKEVMK